MVYFKGEQTFSTEGHIVNFIATRSRIYYICYIYNRFKNFNKNFLQYIA